MEPQEKITVSILCMAYNHEDYIRDALEGFLMQEAPFAYEILINEDASTDGTAAILKEYVDRYPDRVRVLFQEENQYHKVQSIYEDILLPLAKGRYIALCEGDDYWTDPHKLADQVAFLEEHPEVRACVTNTEVLDCRSNTVVRRVNTSVKAHALSMRGLVQHLPEDGFQTSSLLVRKDSFALPKELVADTFGDLSRAVYFAATGGFWYLPQTTGVYRYFSKGSFSERTYGKDRETYHAQLDDLIGFLKRAETYCGEEYREVFEEEIRRQTVFRLILEKQYKTILKEYKPEFRRLDPKSRLSVRIRSWFT